MNVRIYQRIRGGPWWVAYINSAGKYVRRSLDTRDYVRAEALAYSMGLGSANGQALVGDDAKVETLIRKYLEQPHTLRPRSRLRLEQVLARVRDGLGGNVVTDLGFRAAVKSYRAQRVNMGRSTRTANYEVQALHQVIIWAVDIYPGLVDPLAGLKRVREPHRETRSLTPDEVRRLLGALKTPEERLRIGVYLYTGMRRGEGTHLWWSQVDRKAGVIAIEPHEGFTPKNGEARLVPICPELDRILEEAPRRSIYVLTTRSGRPFHSDLGNSLLRWLKAVYRRAGIRVTKGMGLHTLRHTYCSHLARHNVRAELRAKLLGHRVLAMQDRYTHTLQDDALAAGKRLDYA